MNGSNTSMSKIAVDADVDLNDIGERVRYFRKQEKWTLAKLSETTGIPLSTLSKVEVGQMSLNIQKLLKVCRALNIDLMQLVNPEDTTPVAPVVTGRRSITRQGMAKVLSTDNANYEHHASDFSNRKLVPVVVDLKTGLNPEMIRHQGEEFIFVIEGTVEILTEYYEPELLEKGESIYIDSSMAHNVRAVGDKSARILNVMTQVPKHL